MNLSDGHIDILRNLVRTRIQMMMAADVPEKMCRFDGNLRNIDDAAHILTIYDLLSTIASKWDKDYPQFGFAPLKDDGVQRTVKGTYLYLARDGTLKKRSAPD
jgi:hypothetical protein